MRLVPFGHLMKWMVTEYEEQGMIFGIPKIHFFKKSSDATFNIFGEECQTVLGPAAGPHSQLVQNLVVSYLVGGRFLELKTVYAGKCEFFR